MKRIPLTRGRFALVDDGDYERLSARKWCCTADLYAVTSDLENKGKKLRMHRVVLDAPAGVDVDHIDGDRLNNTRENLRLCDDFTNQANRKSAGGRSRFKGVQLHPGGKWQAQIRVRGTMHYLGLYRSEMDAAIAYDRAAISHHGEYARTNILPRAEAA